VLCATTAALAGEGEHALFVGPTYGLLVSSADGVPDRNGVGGRLGYEYGLDDFWNLVTELDWTHHFGDLPIEVGLAQAGIRYNIDAFEWVPHATLLLGGALLLPDGADADGDFSIAAGIGVDYRGQRELAFGVDVRYHAFVSSLENIPAYLTVGLRVVFFPD
jgi:hypothetical protein